MKWALWRRKRRNAELQEEIQAHLLLAEREGIESGQTEKEARHSARRKFGNLAIAEELTRDMWGWRRLVLQQSLGMTFLGIGIGTVAALAAARILESLVEGMQPTVLSTFMIMIALLVLAAMLASLVPARRASRVDPMFALRQE